MVSAEEDIQYLILIVRKDEEIQSKKKFLSKRHPRASRGWTPISAEWTTSSRRTARRSLRSKSKTRELLSKVKGTEREYSEEEDAPYADPR